jgi:hypothetical protein
MIRFQVHLTEEQSQKLKTLAARKGLSVSEVVRRCVDIALASECLPDQDEIKSRARAMFGAFQDSRSDVSENHDRYLAGQEGT